MLDSIAIIDLRLINNLLKMLNGFFNIVIKISKLFLKSFFKIVISFTLLFIM
jgi:hypothetical protein